MADSLYRKYGGAASIAAVVQDFYKRLLADRTVSQYFDNTDVSALIAHQTNFVGRALGGPEIYDGRDLAEAHAALGVTEVAFETVAEHLAAALIAAGFSDDDCETTIELIGSLRRDVVTA